MLSLLIAFSSARWLNQDEMLQEDETPTKASLSVLATADSGDLPMVRCHTEIPGIPAVGQKESQSVLFASASPVGVISESVLPLPAPSSTPPSPFLRLENKETSQSPRRAGAADSGTFTQEGPANLVQAPSSRGDFFAASKSDVASRRASFRHGRAQAAASHLRFEQLIRVNALGSLYGADAATVSASFRTFDKERLSTIASEMFSILADVMPEPGLDLLGPDFSVMSAVWMPQTKEVQGAETEDELGFACVNQYVLLQEIGRGSFGTVFLAAKSDGDCVNFAVKCMEKRRVKKWELSRAGDNDALMKEIAIMKKLRHRNIASLLEVIEDAEAQKIYLVMPYYERGPLLKVSVDGACSPLDLDVARGYMRQLCNAVQYLHNHRVVHRDIKPENVLLGSDGSAYLSDFGVSTLLSLHDDTVVATSDGTPAYLAPEILAGPSGSQRLKGFPLDIWALGVTFYIMIYGRFPFQGTTVVDLAEMVRKGRPKFSDTPLDDETSVSEWRLANSLLQQMLDKDPAMRITVNACRCHPFFRNRTRRSEAFGPPNDVSQSPSRVMSYTLKPEPPRPQQLNDSFDELRCSVDEVNAAVCSAITTYTSGDKVAATLRRKHRPATMAPQFSSVFGMDSTAMSCEMIDAPPPPPPTAHDYPSHLRRRIIDAQHAVED